MGWDQDRDRDGNRDRTPARMTPPAAPSHRLRCLAGGLRHGRLLPLHRVAGGGRQPLPPLLRQLEPGGGAGQPGGRARPPRLLLLHGTAPIPLPSPPGPSRGPGAPHTLSAPTQAGNISHALTLSKEFLHYGTGLSLVSGCPRHLCVPPAPLPSFFWHGRGKSPRTEAKEVGDGDVGLWVTPPRPSRPQ